MVEEDWRPDYILCPKCGEENEATKTGWRAYINKWHIGWRCRHCNGRSKFNEWLALIEQAPW